MTAKLMKQALLLVKIQPIAGTDSNPTAALNAILCKGVTPQPLVANFAERDNIRPYFGQNGKVLTDMHSESEFEVELAGAGVAGTAPKWGPLIRACGFAETITASTDVKYNPITANQEMVTGYYFIDGLRFKMLDCKGNGQITMNAKGIPMLKFKLTVLYSPVTDTPIPAGTDYSGFTEPVAVNKLNTPTWSLHGYAGAVESLSFDCGNEVVYRNLIGRESVSIRDRKMTGSISMEMTSVAEKDWFATVIANTKGALQIVHGTVAGNIIQIDAPKVQLTDPQISDSEGIVMLGANLALEPDEGNDDILITVK
ncbi:phage tail tube protein [Herbaspirillum sp. GCM10030257]|uniref:phage tail tube protein n=1 Tax=Herbaspirillum sp. GCM10030257 TaxID=3273393 RepID=UPI0036112B0C